MASVDTMTIHSSMHEDDQPDDVDDGNDEDDHHHHPHNLSRLSICSSNSKQSMYDNDDEEYCDMRMYMSLLSLEGSEGDADEELSDEKEGKEVSGVSSDSDKELGCFSLPATPSSRRVIVVDDDHQPIAVNNEYGSENEGDQKGLRNKMRRNSRRRIKRERWLERCWEKKQQKKVVDDEEKQVSGESECLVISRGNGERRRSLCLDLEEVKGCRDLGFELEHERMLEIPSRINSISGSTMDTSSGGNSPIANWRISSPGDDPRDVKARLKIWAQAVALASASQLGW